MRDNGARRALAFVTSPFGGYSSCRQYLEDLAGRASIGPGHPIDKIRHYHDHPGFIEPLADAYGRRWLALRLTPPRLVFTAHSIPTAMAAKAARTAGATSPNCARLRRWSPRRPRPGLAWDLVAVTVRTAAGPMARAGHQRPPRAARHGGRGGRGEPDRLHLRPPRGRLGPRHRGGGHGQAARAASARARTPGSDPRFVAMVRDLVLERLDPGFPRARLGEVRLGPPRRLLVPATR